MVSHKATYLNVHKLGSCNCSSRKLLEVINITRPECSVVARDHILAYGPVFIARAKLGSIITEDAITQILAIQSSNLLGKCEIFLLRIDVAFFHLLRDRV